VWERVIALLAAGRTGADKVVGLRTGLDHWHEAFEGMHSGQVIKSVLLPHGPDGPQR
jgi:alcohol dehydrogenase/L-iditol 2-dehydrogenase